MLTIIDEYFRFSFAFPYSNINAETVIKSLTQLFSLFGLCSCIHSDRGSAFMSKSLLHFYEAKVLLIVGRLCITRVVMVNVKSTMT